MKLENLLQSIEVKNVKNDQDLNIFGISYHSQKVSNGHLFVCVRGYKTDGHKYLKQAAENGAVAAVVEEFNEEVTIPQYLVEDSRISLARLGAHFYDNPSKKLNMIGITATNGKTTTSYMTNAILENEGFKTGLIGTVSIKIADTSIPSELTTPESLDLQYYLNEMAERDVTHVSMEVSSQALEMHRVEQVDYDIVTLNNVSREHIDSHGSFEKYFEVKSSLIRNASETSFAVLNLDCPYSASLVNATKAQVITFGVKSNEGHIYCKNLDLSTGRAKFTVEIMKSFKVNDTEYIPGEFDIELAVPGLHSVYNAMVAITVALLSNVAVSTIQRTLKTFGGVERRFEFIFEDDFKIIDDHFANAGNINVTLETLKFMDYKKLHLVYAIRGERGPTVNRENAETIANWAPKLGFNEVIATKSISHVTSKDKVTDEEQQVFEMVMDQAEIKVQLCDELPDAIAKALARAEEGDLILLAGCQGMDHGAEIALHQIEKIKKDFSKEKLFMPLRKRVSGQ
ncbi:UDP-N-acetylmuramoyl-L-alanyl-D-glutamate--2,6-diaminopimelate ligase [Bacillus sp. DTU_2020_1000418_1_SI_GHA_SEK_038]|uniref:Mur ligase family protein n=1 Tax=Bacillus sp. DTU_2020_1000418_1_SI_GHA_SEK_038 TaxID=3077585 RepID=UPI0028EEE2C4|nr:UDP-N-acetylmuramoyl-L-alanyl-D-glutamate--2,6-diaminopimelate ligase [Bacillus sp. DTU_2020_1000418_1_SI_GHA_SEK_038]WNS75873.1 UDP-N-acetylmuramoyl-L-alanyl-D-glutamate--2,6-diaminopimelate ligase [Bacillus sp. DTU_2020_1000418_1_SI_GHA_SEK_038]